MTTGPPNLTMRSDTLRKDAMKKAMGSLLDLVGDHVSGAVRDVTPLDSDGHSDSNTDADSEDSDDEGSEKPSSHGSSILAEQQITAYLTDVRDADTPEPTTQHSDTTCKDENTKEEKETASPATEDDPTSRAATATAAPMGSDNDGSQHANPAMPNPTSSTSPTRTDALANMPGDPRTTFHYPRRANSTGPTLSPAPGSGTTQKTPIPSKPFIAQIPPFRPKGTQQNAAARPEPERHTHPKAVPNATKSNGRRPPMKLAEIPPYKPVPNPETLVLPPYRPSAPTRGTTLGTPGNYMKGPDGTLEALPQLPCLPTTQVGDPRLDAERMKDYELAVERERAEAVDSVIGGKEMALPAGQLPPWQAVLEAPSIAPSLPPPPAVSAPTTAPPADAPRDAQPQDELTTAAPTADAPRDEQPQDEPTTTVQDEEPPAIAPAVPEQSADLTESKSATDKVDKPRRTRRVRRVRLVRRVALSALVRPQREYSPEPEYVSDEDEEYGLARLFSLTTAIQDAIAGEGNGESEAEGSGSGTQTPEPGYESDGDERRARYAALVAAVQGESAGEEEAEPTTEASSPERIPTAVSENEASISKVEKKKESKPKTAKGKSKGRKRAAEDDDEETEDAKPRTRRRLLEPESASAAGIPQSNRRVNPKRAARPSVGSLSLKRKFEEMKAAEVEAEAEAEAEVEAAEVEVEERPAQRRRTTRATASSSRVKAEDTEATASKKAAPKRSPAKKAAPKKAAPKKKAVAKKAAPKKGKGKGQTKEIEPEAEGEVEGAPAEEPEAKPEEEVPEGRVLRSRSKKNAKK
ncbi:hypothetical protein CYLTODRAFT_465318 [Cylindrobasidium torrendii FP15055 ss-10]|uniref:Uncharacterized protein n=1 Tax=Cylindrobasidium torrendii FP15055 ss-10 TaxID=1314674 RepID=A0A0D7B5W2_9AGAR|nr:hypothetical protein CYLTODRAFT_465318 [Cylindrobasidium torrendii FP15055 ss-10]